MGMASGKPPFPEVGPSILRGGGKSWGGWGSEASMDSIAKGWAVTLLALSPKEKTPSTRQSAAPEARRGFDIIYPF
jgi:hypothetical protein